MIFKPFSCLFRALLVCGVACSALAVNSSIAASKEVTLFYPGTATWESMLIPDSHPGAGAVRQRKACDTCHRGQEAEIGKALSSNAGNSFYKKHDALPSLKSRIDITADGEKIYFKVYAPGVETGQVVVLLDDGAFESSASSGCWASCHQDNRGMPAAGSMDLTKYLSRSRQRNTREGGGESYKSADELAQLVKSGEFLELLGASFSASEAKPIHGYILERRHTMDEQSMSARRDGDWVTFSRALVADESTSKPIVQGKQYSLGVALHQGNSRGAGHLVSFPVLFELDSQGSVSIVKP